MLVTKYLVWMIGVALCVASLFSFYWPKYQFRLMKLMKLKPSVKSDRQIRRVAILKLAFGIALIALSVAL
jgi:uncharacterized membrane protein